VSVHTAVDPHDRPWSASSAPQLRILSDAAVTALRGALQALVGDYAPPGDLRRAIVLMCDEARRNGLRAEQLVITIKQAWESIPEVCRHVSVEQRTRVLSGVVTMCIDEFYAGAVRAD
jgi:hypothetical protein